MKRTKEEAMQTRAGILDAAEQVFFEHGVSRATLAQVAHAAGLTRGAIYWHFQDKADLFNAVVERVRTPTEMAFYQVTETEDTLEDLERLCARALMDLHKDQQLKRVYTILLLKCEYTEDMTNLIKRERAVKEQAIMALTGFFTRLQKTGQIVNTRSPRILALALYAYMLGLFTDYLRSPEMYRMPKDAGVLVGNFFAPLNVQVHAS